MNFRIFGLCTPATGMTSTPSRVPRHCQKISRHVGLHLPKDREDYWIRFQCTFCILRVSGSAGLAHGLMGALASLITDAHPALSTAFCRHLCIFTSRRYFQPSQSWSYHPPSSRVYSQLLSHGRLTSYMSHPFQSFIFTICNNIQIFVHFPKFPVCSYSPYSLFYHRSVNTLTIFLSHVFSL